MCASLSGASEEAAADIEAARRRGRIGGIDLALADKVVGAGADTSRASTIEWQAANELTAWRFGLATSTGMVPPQNLIDKSSPQLRAWQARAPMLSAEARLPSARVATGLGVFSSQALMDLYSAVYDATDPSDLGQSDAWQVRLAMVGKDLDTRLGAMPRTRAGWKARPCARCSLAPPLASHRIPTSKTTRPTSSPRCSPPEWTAKLDAGPELSGG
jgi:hypothetical protein